MNFPDFVAFTLDRLEENGYSAYLVGGCVRDHLMGSIPNDYDITTNATPDEIERCFCDVKTLDIGKKHGTISIVFDKEIVEVTTYRIDGEYKDSRHPESVTFTDRIEDDLARRDFTMNAIAYSPKRGFVDPFGGRDDIKKGIIRCVGDPCVRFTEDALRIMRALRFSSRLGFDIEDNTKCAVFDKMNLLSNIAAERINTEFCGILDGKDSGRIILSFFDVFRFLIPEITSLDYDSISRARDFDRTTKLVVFFFHFDDTKQLCEILKRLKFDSKTVKSLTNIIPLFNRYFSCLSEYDIRKAVSLIGVDDTFTLYKALYCHEGNRACLFAIENLNEFVKNDVCMSIKQLEVKGNEIIEKYNINPSITGRVLSMLLEDVLKNEVLNEKMALIDRAKLYI